MRKIKDIIGDKIEFNDLLLNSNSFGAMSLIKKKGSKRYRCFYKLESLSPGDKEIIVCPRKVKIKIENENIKGALDSIGKKIKSDIKSATKHGKCKKEHLMLC